MSRPTRVWFPLLALVFVLPSPICAQPQAALFAPGTVSTPAYEGPFAFTPDGRTLYFVRYSARMAAPGFFVSRARDGGWSQPEPAAMPDGIAPSSFSLSPDGQRIFYTHARDAAGRARLWVADREGDGWNHARPVGGALERWDADQISPSLAADGTLYFASNRRIQSGGWDVYRSMLRDGFYQEPELVGGGRYRGVSTLQQESSVTVAPDGRFIIFSTVGAQNGFGGSDLYVAELAASDSDRPRVWNLGRIVNGADDENDPRVSADGRRLFFCRGGDIYQVDLDLSRRPSVESAAWQPLGRLPAPRDWPRTAAARGKVYVYGALRQGTTTARPRNHVDVLDLATNTWSTLPPAPTEFDAADIVTTGDRLLLLRACAGERPAVAEFDGAAGAWRVTSHPSSREGEGGCRTETRSVVLGRKVFILFRPDGMRPFNAFAEYDLETGAWTPRRSMPAPAWHLAAHRGLIYAFAAGEEARRVVAYDPASDCWTDVGAMHMPVWGTAAVSFQDHIWLIGGHGQRSLEPVGGEPTEAVVQFDPTRGTWSYGPDLPSPRLLAAAVIVGGRLLVVGTTRMGADLPGDQSVLEYRPSKAATSWR